MRVSALFILAALLIGCGLAASPAHAQTVQDIDGNDLPNGIAVDSQGNVFLSESNEKNGSLVRVIVAVDGSVSLLSTVKTISTAIDEAECIAVDRSGNIFVCDGTDFVGTVEEITAASGYATTVTLATGFSALVGPAIAVDSSGDVFVADAANNVVKEIVAVDGSIPASPTISTVGSGFNFPTGVAVDSSGNVYVADSGNNVVKEIVAVDGSIPASPTIRTLAGGFSGVLALAVDSSGNVYVTEPEAPFVQKILAVNGSIPASPAIVTLGAGAATLSSPAAVAVGSSGNVFVADRNSGVLELLTGTSTSVTATPNPSTFGQSVTFTATVTAPGAAPADAIVTFDADGAFLGFVPVTMQGGLFVATLATTFVPGGAHNVTATFSENGVLSPSTSASLRQTVNPAASTTAVASSANPSTIGENVTFTAEVSGPGLAAATGSVIFQDGGTPLGSAVPLNIATARFSTIALAAGSHMITAVYSGDGNYASNTSPVLTQVVSATAPSLPTVTAISPAGGTVVTITGSNLTGATVVAFGGNAASVVIVTSATQVTAAAPPGLAGTVDVTVTTPGGTSTTSSGDQFTYLAAPATGTNGIYSFASSSGTNGSGNQQFARPFGVALDRAGHRLFVADAPNARVQVLNSDSMTFIATIGTTGTPGTDNAHLKGPSGVAFDPASSRVFVADTANDRIQVFDGTSLAYQATIGVTGVTSPDNGHLAAPVGLDIDSADQLLIADSGEDRIQIYSATSLAYVATIGTAGAAGGDSAHLSGPFDVKANPVTGQIWVADTGNKRIQIFDGTSDVYAATAPGPVGSAYSLPEGLGFDPVAGTGLVSDTGNNRIIVYDAATARPLAELGGTGAGNGQFNGPGGVAADPANSRVLIADGNNTRLEIFSDIPTPLVSSVLPGSRSVETGTPATIFATMINASTTPLANCQLGISSAVAALGMGFNFQSTNPATNSPTGTANAPVAIPGNGVATIVLSFSDASPITLPAQPLDYDCDGIAPAAPVTGVNSVDLTFASSPIADIIALAATISGDGVIHIANGAGAFAVATIDAGAAAGLTVTADTGTALLPIAVTLCQTNAQAHCLATPAASLSVSFAANATPTFSIFVSASGAIPFAPGSSRVFVRFKDAAGASHGATSVAVTTN